MRPPSRGVKATLLGRGARVHLVECRVRSGGAMMVEVELLRDNRRRAEGDQLLLVTVGEARQLMRALQAAANEADRLFYRATKAANLAAKTAQELERDVAKVAEALVARVGRPT